MEDQEHIIELIEIGLEEDTVSEISMDCEPEEDRENTDQKAGKARDVMKEIFSYAVMIAAALIVALAVNRFVVINAHVPSASMYPTINADDRLIGFRLAYLFSEPERGDIIIFRYPDDESQIFIKRVIGIPGDTVEIVSGALYLNGELQEESYLAEVMVGSFGPYEVPEDCYFVLGDNRNISEDARYWKNTYVTRDQILAKAVFRYAPSFTALE